MKDIGRLLRDGDPVALEPEMSAADVQAVRRAVLAALATTDRATSRWPGPLLAGAAVTAALAAGVFVGSPNPGAARVTHRDRVDARLGRRGRASSTAVRVARRDAHHLGLRSGVQSMKRMDVMQRVGSLAGLAAAITLAAAATVSAHRPRKPAATTEPPVKTAVAAPQGLQRRARARRHAERFGRRQRTCRRPRGRRWPT